MHPRRRVFGRHCVVGIPLKLRERFQENRLHRQDPPIPVKPRVEVLQTANRPHELILRARSPFCDTLVIPKADSSGLACEAFAASANRLLLAACVGPIAHQEQLNGVSRVSFQFPKKQTPAACRTAQDFFSAGKTRIAANAGRSADTGNTQYRPAE